MAKAKETSLPEEYQPLSPWAYFGYHVLYSIPIVGWVFMIIFALDSSNINRRNFSRSYFVVYIVLAVLFAILAMSGALFVLVENLTGKA